MSSTSQEWISGTPNGGSGTNYLVKILTNQDHISFDSLWFNNKAGKFILLPSTGKDTLTLLTTINDPYMESKSMAPIKYKGEGLIRYIYKGKKHYLVIKHFRKLPLLTYP